VILVMKENIIMADLQSVLHLQRGADYICPSKLEGLKNDANNN